MVSRRKYSEITCDQLIKADKSYSDYFCKEPCTYWLIGEDGNTKGKYCNIHIGENEVYLQSIEDRKKK